MNLITSLDFLGNQPEFYIFKKDLYKAFIGGCLSIITAIAIASLSLYFIITAFSRQQVNLLSSETSNYDKRLDLSNVPILFSPANKGGVLFNTSMAYPVFQYWTFPAKSKGAVNVTTIPYKKCNMSDIADYEDLFAEVPNLSSYYCMNKAGLNLTLSGDYGDINNGYSKMMVYMAKCRNDSILNPNPIGRAVCLRIRSMECYLLYRLFYT
jgi:hypothetical protein